MEPEKPSESLKCGAGLASLPFSGTTMAGSVPTQSRIAVRSRTRPLPATDARSVLESGKGGPRAAWNEQGEAWVALGAVVVITGHGPERFQIVRRQAEALFAGLTHTPEGDVPAGVGPRLVGGGSFHPLHAAESVWSHFEGARFWLPARQVTWVEGRAYETINEVSEPARTPPPEGAAIPRRSAEPRTVWTGRAARALRSMDALSLQKVVLARSLHLPPARPVPALYALAAREPGTTRFLFEPVPKAAFVGATPERLVRLRGGVVDTHALAGSAPRGQGDDDARLARALATSRKDELEHTLVVQHIQARLRAGGAQGIQTGQRRIRRLRSVQHLETPIRARLEGIHVLDLVALLHPTPATAGAPVQPALRLLESIEPFDRGWYTGPVGWFDARGEGEFVVALRCALMRPDGAWLYAGAGLVAGSDPMKEWEETESKLDAMRAVLAKAESP